MFQNINFDEKTIENALFMLQEAALDLNELKEKRNKNVPIEMCDEMLNLCINTVRNVLDYKTAVDNVFDQVDKMGKHFNK